jgi:type IV pilus assembly protein PilF
LTACSSKPEKPQPVAETPAKINADLGLGYMQQGDYKRAMEKLQTALQYNPNYDRAHHYMAELNRRLGDTESANFHYSRALELAPEDAQLRNNYGAYLCEQDRFADAEEQLLLAVNDPLFEGRLQAVENIGLCAYEAGDKVKAEKYLRSALKVNPTLPKSLLQMAILNYEQKDYLRARAYLQRYEAIAPASAESLWLGVRIEHHMGERKIMQQYAEQLSRQFPDTEQWRAYTERRW